MDTNEVLKFESFPPKQESRNEPYSHLCTPANLPAEASFTDKSILLQVGDEVDATLSGFFTASQLREFAAWLIEVANKFDADMREGQ
jgi:hypothetical protein